MTQETANGWWNTVANYGRDLNSSPTMPTLPRMAEICQELLPVLHVHLNFMTDEVSFWKRAREVVMMISHANPFPDPYENFPLFVLFLYTFRELLKPSTIPLCLIYAEQFCPEPPGNFFFSSFLFAVTDPELAVRCFYFMHTNKHRLWVKFMEQPGVAERCFDLFLSFLAANSVDNEEANLSIKLHMALMMSELLIEKKEMVLRGKIFESLVKSICKLIETVPTSICMPFARCIVWIGNMSVEARVHAPLGVLMEKLMPMFEKRTIYKGYLLQWVVSHFTEFNDVAVLNGLLKPQCLDLRTLDVLMEMARMSTSQGMNMIVCFFARVMIQNTVWARSVGTLLPELLAAEKCEDATRKWFRRYLKYSFMTLKMVFDRKKYQRRMITWLSIVTSGVFMSVDWIASKITVYARRVLAENTALLENFLDLSSDVVESASWNQEFEEFRHHGNMLKYLPFRQQSSSLFKVPTKARTVELPPEVQQLGLDLSFARYVTFKPDQKAMSQVKMVCELEDYRSSILDKFKECEACLQTCFDASQFAHRDRPILIAYNKCIRELDSELLEIQKSIMTRYTDNCAILLEAMDKDKRICVDASALVRSFEKERVGNLPFLRIKDNRNALVDFANRQVSKYTVISVLTNQGIQGHLLEAIQRMDSDVGFSPPSNLEDILADRISTMKDATVIDDASLLIKEQACEMMVRTIDDFTTRVANEFEVGENVMIHRILFTSIIRLVFDNDYTKGGSMLTKYESENKEIYQKCTTAPTDMTSMGFTEGLVTRMKVRKAGFRGQRAPNLVDLSFQRNPLDIAYKIYRAVQRFQKLFNDGQPLCESDLVRMIFVCLTAAPPYNLASMHAFIMTWHKALITDPRLSAVVDAFHKAYEMICDEKIVCK